MTWNYRVMHHVANGGHWYAIHQVHYDSTHLTVKGWSKETCHPQGETIEELKRDIKMMEIACEKEVLKYDKV